MRQALYRKYRSTSLAEVVGQTHVTDVLARALKAKQTNHAYLLTGPRGVGKTSIARILAHEINNLAYNGDTYLDIIEIDAASNNGVDDIRDLRDKVTIAPVSSEKKIYIIDEVHMLSKPAFNALLKTLEEPPTHAVFILATTEVHKLPDTILSRTQRFHFRPISQKDMTNHLRHIASQEKIKIDDKAIELIARRARGSFRDGISLLDQLSSGSEEEITHEIVRSILGLANDELIDKLQSALKNKDVATAVRTLQAVEELGVSPVVFADQLCDELRKNIVEYPDFITLIDSLIEIGKSYDPSLKLLAVIANYSHNAPRKSPQKTIALATSAEPVLVATHTPPKPLSDKQEKATESVKKIAIPKNTQPEIAPTSKKIIDEIIWPKVMAHVRENYVALYGVLNKASMVYEDNIVKLHFTYALHKKKIDDGKYRQMLTSSIVALYGETPNIETTSGKLPPKNEQAKTVAAIMGGGEEVSVDG